MWYNLALVSTDVSEEVIASITRVKRISELGTMLAVTSNRSTLRSSIVISLIIFNLMMEAIHSSKTSVLTTAKQYHIP
jgi:hypothetical protein